MMPHKYNHVKSLKALDKEIAKAELRKDIIRDDFSYRVSNVREMLKPASLGWQLVKAFIPLNRTKTPSAILIKTIFEILTTTEAAKYALKLLKKTFR